jgi:hypothetical protein
MSFRIGPRRKVELRIDLDEEAHQAKKLAYDMGATDEQAKAAAKAVCAAVNLDPKTGDLLDDVEGLLAPARGPAGRQGVVYKLLERDRLLAFGPDPVAIVRQGLRNRDYSDEEIDPLIARAGLGREPDGRIRYRGRYSQGRLDPEAEVDREGMAAHGEGLLKLAVSQLADQIEAQRRADAIPPEASAEMRERVRPV